MGCLPHSSVPSRTVSLEVRPPVSSGTFCLRSQKSRGPSPGHAGNANPAEHLLFVARALLSAFGASELWEGRGPERMFPLLEEQCPVGLGLSSRHPGTQSSRKKRRRSQVSVSLGGCRAGSPRPPAAPCSQGGQTD